MPSDCLMTSSIDSMHLIAEATDCFEPVALGEVTALIAFLMIEKSLRVVAFMFQSPFVKARSVSRTPRPHSLYTIDPTVQ
jgi:hypothetical protein